MCGVAGVLQVSPRSDLASTVGRMAAVLEHRGPDGGGVWADQEAGVALGHRRLSIIDLSANGAQPMHSSDGRYVITFNGEIYNLDRIRSELNRGPESFRGSSDTEVMLEAISAWGLESALERFVGMFAFAVWDRRERRLHIVRDRMGIKPVYYGWCGGAFLFASELRSFLEHPSFTPQVDRDALALYMRYSYVPGPLSIFQGVSKLPPGSVVSVAPGDGLKRVVPRPYWSLERVVEAGARSRADADADVGDDEAADTLEALLADSVEMRLASDVPLGVFLSGGLDSSVVTALAQSRSQSAMRTFSIGFGEPEYDESERAREVAEALGTDHTELRASPEEALKVLPLMPGIYDEPFADSSQIPTFLVSRLARDHVTVALTGDGGDELFYGYRKYQTAADIWRRLERVPLPARLLAGSVLQAMPDSALKGTLGWLGPRLNSYGGDAPVEDHLRRLGRVATSRTGYDVYRRLMSIWKNTGDLVPGSREPGTVYDGGDGPSVPLEERLMYMDMASYLPDDILTKVDRASMSVGLEARVPLLDHRVVEMVWGLPMSMKMREGRTKWLLRKVLGRHLPADLIAEEKRGFMAPVGQWLRGPLREWAEALLEPTRLRDDGYLDPTMVTRAWTQHLSGRADRHVHLWNVLMFQGWLENLRTGR